MKIILNKKGPIAPFLLKNRLDYNIVVGQTYSVILNLLFSLIKLNPPLTSIKLS